MDEHDDTKPAAQLHNEKVDGRKLDSLHAASMDYRQLAAMIDGMKKHVNTAKKNVINKLSRRIKILKSKKNAEESDNIKNKSQKLIEEIAMIKAMEISRIAKFSLANEETVDNLSRKGKVTPHLLSLTRLAEDKSLKVYVQKWRSEHNDWRILANFILSKNTSRHFKRSEQKKKLTKDSLLIEKELIHARLKQKIGVVPEVKNINKPIVERTSKNSKYKKKGRVYSEDEEEEQEDKQDKPATDRSKNTPSSDSADDDSGDEAERSTTNAADDDLYTFNIVDEDLEDIDQKNTPQPKTEGRQVKVSEEDRSAKPVSSKTKSFASLLFSANKTQDSSDSEDSDDQEEEKSKKKNGNAVTLKSAESKSEITDSKKPINNRKPKTKKETGPDEGHQTDAPQNEVVNEDDYESEDEEGVGEPIHIQEFELPVNIKPRVKKDTWAKKKAPIFKGGQSNKGEMVKTVINLDELSNKNAKSITGDVKESKTSTSTTAPRRKKSAFFLGGEDEIDESLGTNKAEQDRAWRNQKSSYKGYKGVTEKQKNWMNSAFTDSLRDTTAAYKYNDKKHSERLSKTGAAEKDKANKHQRFDKPGAKTFNKTQATAVEPPIESLHPSWQASKRKKEQLELIKAGPSNKKIKFDD